MQSADFNGKSGKVVQTARGYLAYVPNPLEPQIDLSLSIVKALSAADRALSELAGIARTLPNPHLLIGPFLRREAVLSSRIEGTQASFSDLLFFEAARLREKEVPDVREVSNYVQALEYGLARLSTLPVSLRLIREIHQRLMAGVRGETQTPGEFRNRRTGSVRQVARFQTRPSCLRRSRRCITRWIVSRSTFMRPQRCPRSSVFP